MQKNWILSLHPLTKVYFTLMIAISVFIVSSYWFAFSMFPVCIVIAALAGVHKEFLKNVFLALSFLLVVVFFMQAFFYPGNEVVWEFGFLTIKAEGIQYGLMMTSRILAIGSAFLLFFRITTIRDFVKSLEDIGLPPMGAYVVLSTLQIIPEMKKHSKIIMDAQKTRGIETEGSVWVRAKAFIPTLTPLILSSIASTEERAITLEARAFMKKTKKTNLHKLTKGPIDRVLPIVFILIIIGLIIGRVLS
ncbi:energy-coupling factor transporter transmembrane protein EcfT [Radiobacillus kanasensis]|uniref:energy-coupling factor transporter transmembrane component T family protein n=1 Tax=Radiobacillus kanasensis TaxID=2844358 RepID=UPI001E5223FA|nr:energy-coupling factor transporter transmembrane component T [Radiobacillus kanasensis]UFT98700.1 energy-coupling factor transporter transmembrane protein EcfT [Radiobacillus kanasensis]